MIVHRGILWPHMLRFSWKSLLYYFLLAFIVWFCYEIAHIKELAIPFLPVATLSTALAIFLSFRNNSAYDRWWEARKIWGLAVNYSRAWARQVTTFMSTREAHDVSSDFSIKDFKQTLVYRHIAFIHALRIFLRKQTDYSDVEPLISSREYELVNSADNPPNMLLQRQGESLAWAVRRGLVNTYQQIQLDQTLVEFNNIQGRCERIKNTPMPRQYNYFPRLFVFIHNTLLPFGFIGELGWTAIPLSLVVSFVFLMLDLVGADIEDPFENRLSDTPMTALSVTIEGNLKEQLKETILPEKITPEDGVLL